MISKFRLVIAMVLITIPLSFKMSAQEFEVEIRLRNAEGLTFNIQKLGQNQAIILGSGKISNGEMKISGKALSNPEYVALVTSDRSKGVAFFLENKKITISGTLDSISNVKVTGSKTQDEYQKLRSLLKPLNDRSNQMGKEYQQAASSGNNKKMEEILGDYEELRIEMNLVRKEFIKSNPSSYASPQVLSEIVSTKLMKASDLIELAESLSPAVKGTATITEIKRSLTALMLVDIGKKAPDFKMNDVNGKEVSLSSLTGKGLLLIDFWAAWCGPCRRENPFVVKTYNEFHSKGFDILGVSLDRTREDWIKAIEDDKLTWTHVSDLKYFQNSAAVLYSVNAIPANFLLDRNGVIIAKDLRGEALVNKVRELLGEK